jgi:hypothetical protein
MDWPTTRELVVSSIASIHKVFLTALLLASSCACQPVQGVPPTPPQERKTMNLNEYKRLEQEITRSLEEASVTMKEEQWTDANTLLKAALAKLGENYLVPNIIDETGMKLVLADTQEHQNAVEMAAHIRHKMLTSRLALLRQKIEGLQAVEHK